MGGVLDFISGMMERILIKTQPDPVGYVSYKLKVGKSRRWRHFSVPGGENDGLDMGSCRIRSGQI